MAETFCLMGDVRGKNVLEIACGSGASLVWMGEKGAKEIWGLDISAAQIKRANALLKNNGKAATFFNFVAYLPIEISFRFFIFL